MQGSVTIVSHYAASIANFRGPLIRDLISRSCTVRVLAPDWAASHAATVSALGARTESLPLSRLGLNVFEDFQTFRYLFQHFRKTKPNVVLTYAAKTNVWGMLAARLAGVPHRVAMVEGMGYAFTEGQQGRRTLKQRLLGAALINLYRLAFRCAHQVVVLNPDDARELQAICGLPPEKTTMLGGIGVPLEDWPMQAPHWEPLTFTFVARMLKEKGLFEFMEAARRIKVQYPAVRFCMLGGLDTNPGAVQASEIIRWVEQGVIEWPGQVDIKPWLAKTSVFVLPSYREGVPRSTQEAMAMGRPVITTDVPGCRETVVEGHNGFLIPPRNVDALVKAMERFIADPGMISSMGAESRRLAEERFDVRQINLKLISAMGLA